MATNFPESTDNLINPNGTDPVSSPSHAQQHANVNDAVEAIQSYLLQNLPSSSTYIASVEKGEPGGVAELDGSGQVPISQLGNLIDGAPNALNTLNELAAALNDNENFATTITNQIASIPAPSSATTATRGTIFGLTDSNGNQNTALGKNALLNNTTGNRNVSIGIDSLFSNTIGQYNTSIGYYSLNSNTEGNNNVSVGMMSMYRNTSGGYNIAIGESSLSDNLTGNFNVASGVNSLRFNTTGVGNVGHGYGTLQQNVTGNYNTAIGTGAGQGSGTNNSNNTYIGRGANPSSSSVSNEVTVGNSSITRFRIPGLGIDWTSSTIPTPAFTTTDSPYIANLLDETFFYKWINATSNSNDQYFSIYSVSNQVTAGKQIVIYRRGTGNVTIDAGPGVIIESTGATPTSPSLRARYSAALLVYQGSQTWSVVGDIA